MKVLIVSYCPRGERSRTKQLADYAAGFVKSKKVNVEVLDLAKDVPDLLTAERLSAYYLRNYAGGKPSAKEAALLKKMDVMTAQLKTADIVVVAYPMYNFSQPAIVKAWFDSVMQKGETWDMAQGNYVGLLKGKKALVLSSSGGVYEGDLSFLEHSVSLSKVHLGFMGYETEAVVAAGINRYPEKEGELLAEAKKKISVVFGKWLN
ncbi:MAG: NAD(P)H-dependent oxidoreductase [Candidatus Omnitrophica bacterium]|nr:NAD(P)H-dependent oxidoreductase [Candidatus Omnitrophota bacterium]